MISFYTSTPLSEVEGWTVSKWLKVLAHVAVLRDKEKVESMREQVKFENMKRGGR